MTDTPRAPACLGAARAARLAANDNHPDRVTHWTANNGGCSTVSGMVPVTLARVPSIDGALQVAA